MERTTNRRLARIDELRCEIDALTQRLTEVNSGKSEERGGGGGEPTAKRGKKEDDVIAKRTALQIMNAVSDDRDGIVEYCPHCTKADCAAASGNAAACTRVHFRRLISAHTDPSLGDCSFLDTCRHPERCKYVHYELDPDSLAITASFPSTTAQQCVQRNPFPAAAAVEAQWVNCDVRKFDLGVLGRFGVVMADPPWDIHMTLPYGTLTDDEMKSLNMACLMSEGLLFLWVTGRAMELGRECLDLWGFRLIEEIVWVKTNQLQRVIRTGRTGHWLNHSKEHCLVAVKGNPRSVERYIDCDVIVSEVRATSQKPDEIYSIIDRIAPGERKLELFGRQHNLHDGWVTLGNQLGSTHVVEPCITGAMASKYGSVGSVPGLIQATPTQTAL